MREIPAGKSGKQLSSALQLITTLVSLLGALLCLVESCLSGRRIIKNRKLSGLILKSTSSRTNPSGWTLTEWQHTAWQGHSTHRSTAGCKARSTACKFTKLDSLHTWHRRNRSPDNSWINSWAREGRACGGAEQQYPRWAMCGSPESTVHVQEGLVEVCGP